MKISVILVSRMSVLDL